MKVSVSENKSVDIYVNHIRPDLDLGKDYPPKETLKILCSHKPNRDFIEAYFPRTEVILTVNGQQFKGTSYCSPLDQFRRKKGLAFALERAVEEANLSKEERRVLWGKYFKKTKKGKKRNGKS